MSAAICLVRFLPLSLGGEVTLEVSTHPTPEISSRPHGPRGRCHFKRSASPVPTTFYRFRISNPEPSDNAGKFCGMSCRLRRLPEPLVHHPQRTRRRSTTPSPSLTQLTVSPSHSPGTVLPIHMRQHCRIFFWRQMETGPVTMTGPVPYQQSVGETFSPTRPSRSGSRRYRRSTGPLRLWPSGHPSRSAPRVESRCNREV